jgi:hypothetical protein
MASLKDTAKGFLPDHILMGLVDAIGKDVANTIDKCEGDEFGEAFAPSLMILYVDAEKRDLNFEHVDLRPLAGPPDDDDDDTFPVGFAAYKAGQAYLEQHGLSRMPAAAVLISYGTYRSTESRGELDEVIGKLENQDEDAKDSMSECVTVLLTAADKRSCGKVFEIADDGDDHYTIIDEAVLEVHDTGADGGNDPILYFFMGVQSRLSEMLREGKVDLDLDNLRAAALEYQAEGNRLSDAALELLERTEPSALKKMALNLKQAANAAKRLLDG